MNIFDDSRQKINDDLPPVDYPVAPEGVAPKIDDTANDVIEKFDENTDKVPEVSTELDSTELIDPIQEIKGRIDS